MIILLACECFYCTWILGKYSNFLVDGKKMQGKGGWLVIVPDCLAKTRGEPVKLSWNKLVAQRLLFLCRESCLTGDGAVRPLG